MNARTTVAAFTVGVAALFAAAYGVGSVVGAIGSPPAAHTDNHDAAGKKDGTADTDPGAGHESGQHAENGSTSATLSFPGGLMVSQNGYTLDLRHDIASPGRAQVVEFSITGPDGEPVSQYEVEHDKQLHLIAVRRDFAGFQHVHPVIDDAGTWSVPLDLRPGQWRLFADFTPTGGQALTLGADLLVSGSIKAPVEEPATRAVRVDGYTVTLDGELHAGADAKLTLSVSRDGRPVTDLEPYLGAYGHVVALREGDLAYLHVHPDGTLGDGRTQPGPNVVFYAAVPSGGDYHLYLDFKHDGVVRTAKFQLSAH